MTRHEAWGLGVYSVFLKPDVVLDRAIEVPSRPVPRISTVETGAVTGTATAIHLGGTLTTHEVVMTDEQGRRLSTARITNMVLRGRG